MATSNEIELARCCKNLVRIIKRLGAKDSTLLTEDDRDLFDNLQDVMQKIYNEKQTTKREPSESKGKSKDKVIIYSGLEKGKSWYGIESDEERLKQSGGICDFAVIEDGKVIFAVYLDYTLKTLLQPIFIDGQLKGFCSIGQSKDKKYFRPDYLRNYILKAGAAFEKGLPNPTESNPRLKQRFQDQFYDKDNNDIGCIQGKYKLIERPEDAPKFIAWNTYDHSPAEYKDIVETETKADVQPIVESDAETETDNEVVAEIAE